MAEWMPESVKKVVFNRQGYNQFGLYHDDLYVEDDEDVHEALRRLPPNLQVSFSRCLEIYTGRVIFWS
jgi:Ubiquinol-cytochrome C reductase complex 14kD subunit